MFRPDTLEQAVAAFRQAITLRPDYREAYLGLSNALRELYQYDEALAACQHAISLNPDDARAYNNLGNIFKETGQIDKAIEAYRHAISLQPDAAPPHLNYGQTLLQMGRFSEGWQEYEWRWQTDILQSHKRIFSFPEWNGEPLAHKTILLYSEQGQGDAIHFARYAAELAAMEARVILLVFEPLIKLLRTVPGVAQIIEPGGAAVPDIDYHLSLMSVPRVLGTTVDTIPAPISYISADPARAEVWRARLAMIKGLKVGLAWAGDPRQHDYAANLVDRRRSLKLEQFSGLAKVPGITLFSLQKGAAAEQIHSAPHGLQIQDVMDEMQDFSDTAALVANLDLVISVDTSIVHLAGAMGKPVWVLSRYDGCWRWLQNREDSPWYPTARLFRQTSPGDWNGPLERLIKALNSFGLN